MINKPLVALSATFLAMSLTGQAKTELKNLLVEYQKAPLGIEVEKPRFSWQMVADDKLHGWRQVAYQITVFDEDGNRVWDSGKVQGDHSLNIGYEGIALKPMTRYTWTLNVWNQKKEMNSATSFFETGNVSWKDAQWIGKGGESVMFYAPYFPEFKLDFTVQLDKASRSTSAAFVYGANDPRLMDKYKNIIGVENPKDSSYIKVELDIAPLAKKQPALLNVYRRGYKPQEDGAQPLFSFAIPETIVNDKNKYDAHKIAILCDLGMTSFFVDDAKNPVGKKNLNPTGKSGGDYIAYPVIADYGYAMQPRQKAVFSQVKVCNFKAPHDVVKTLQDEGLAVTGGKDGYLQTVAAGENAAPMLRTTFDVSGKKIKKARIYATARGVYDLYLNGRRVGDAYFNPGSSQYNKTQFYQVFDVTSLLHSGNNAWGAVLGEGWWSGGSTFIGSNWNFFGDRQSLLAKMVVTYVDGTTQVVATSPDTWKASDAGAVRYGSFFQGEVYDARREQAMGNWSTCDYKADGWESAVVMSQTDDVKDGRFHTASDFRMVADIAQPIVAIDTLTAKTCEEVRPGVFVYDLGQNMAGVPLVRFEGLQPGTEVKLRFAEVKYPNMSRYQGNEGMIMTENLRAAMVQDIYVARGGDEVFSPRFTSHGFRYIEITGIDKPLRKEDVRAIVVSSLDHETSHYETSNEDVNRLWLNTVWSTRSNFMSIPTDCPQRNERLGWMGDISVFGRSASFLSNAAQFLRRYLISVRDMQSDKGQFPDVAPTGCGFGGLLWGSAGVTVPWESYLQYGDKAMLEEHYASMKRYIQFVLDNYIDKNTNVIVQYRQWGDLGDWLSLEDARNDKSLIWESYFVFDLDIMARVANVLGKVEDAKWFADLASQRRDFFVQTYVDKETGKTLFSSFDERKKGKLVDTQTSYVLPLAFDVVSGEIAKKMAENLKTTIERSDKDFPSYSLLTGFIGTAWISKALSDKGMSDVAYRLLQQTTFPSWLYPVKNGATTVWERLNSYTEKDGFGSNNSMNSFNHYSFGAVVAWMYNYSLGIRRDENNPGFKHFVLQPEPDPTGGILHAEGYYDSMYGRIESGWRKNGTDTEYKFSVPANSSATLYLSARSPKLIREVNKAIKRSGIVATQQSDVYKVELPAGEYHFVVNEK